MVQEISCFRSESGCRKASEKWVYEDETVNCGRNMETEMEKKLNLPKGFINAVGKYGIGEKDIIFAVAADLDEEFRFSDTIFALTDEKLLIAKYPYVKEREYRLGGYDSLTLREDPAELEEPALLLFSLEQVERLEVIRQVSTGVLMGEIDGTERCLCRFSNTRMEAFMRLGRLLEKLKKKEEIKPEDLDVRKGKECCPKCGMIYPDQERKVCPKCMDKRSILLRVVSYFKPYKAQLCFMVICYLGTALLNLAWPYLSGTILYDKVLARDEAFLTQLGLPAGRFVTALGFVVLSMILTKAFMQFLGIMQGVFTARIAPDVVAKLKSQVFDAMGKLSISFFTKRQTGGLMTRVADDAEEISGFFIDGIPYFFINVGTIIATCVIMFLLNPLLAVISIVLMPILFFISIAIFADRVDAITEVENGGEILIHDMMAGFYIIGSLALILAAVLGWKTYRLYTQAQITTPLNK